MENYPASEGLTPEETRDQLSQMIRIKQALTDLETPQVSPKEPESYSEDTEVLFTEDVTPLPTRGEEPLPKRR